MALLTTYSDPIRIAVIGGTGLSTLPGFTPVAELTVNTPWGAPSAPISVLHHTPSASPDAHPSDTAGSAKPTPIAFLSRHGAHHEYAPHEIPTRANIAALRSLGVRSIIAFSAVGSLQEHIAPRDFVIPDQIIDRTKGVRPFTFFEKGMVGHVPFADPFDPALRSLVRRVGERDPAGVLGQSGGKVHGEGVLICMEGPQFSTRAESNVYRSWGGSVINMSALPEAKLAREAEIAYCMICMSTDYDCWRVDTEGKSEDVSVEMVMGHMRANSENARGFLAKVLDELCKGENEETVMARSIEGSVRFAGAMTKSEGRGKEAVEELEWLLPGYFTS